MAPVDDVRSGEADPPSRRTNRPEENSLRIAYARHERIAELVDVVRYCLEAISLGFDGWETDHAKGPGFYLAVVSGTDVEEYADPMGANRWPVETCRDVFGGTGRFYAGAATVASEMDGAVIASIDGVLQEQMVRLKDLPREAFVAAGGSRAAYEPWMGSRHMNALDTSLRADVVATITLSEEDGRVTVFSDGQFEDDGREAVGGRWRAES
jgi:hypothetical protein